MACMVGLHPRVLQARMTRRAFLLHWDFSSRARKEFMQTSRPSVPPAVFLAFHIFYDSIVSIARKEPRLDKNITMCNGLDKKPSEILPWERLLSADLACPLQRKTQTKFAECATTLVKRADA